MRTTLDSITRIIVLSINPIYKIIYPVKAEPVTLRFRNDYVDEVLDKFGFAIQLVPDNSYFFTTTVTVEPTPEFFGWIFSLGFAAKIIGPDSVRRTMYNKAWSQARTYRDKKKRK